jgi:hypothetical protein
MGHALAVVVIGFLVGGVGGMLGWAVHQETERKQDARWARDERKRHGRHR